MPMDRRLSQRKEVILRALMEEYVRTAEPVASKGLSDRLASVLGVSPGRRQGRIVEYVDPRRQLAERPLRVDHTPARPVTCRAGAHRSVHGAAGARCDDDSEP